VLLDTQTTLIYSVVTNLTLAVLLLVAFHHRFTPALRFWLANQLCQAGGWLLISLQNIIDPAIATTLGPTLIGFGFAFLLHALLLFYQVPVSRLWPYWPTAFTIAATLAFHENAAARQMALNFTFAIHVAAGAIFLISRQDTFRALRWLMSFCALAAAAMMFVRIGYLASHPADIPPILRNDALQSMTFGIGFVLRLAFNCGFLLLLEARRHDDLNRLAAMDALTGMYNRRTFMELAEGELARTRRNGRPLTLLIFDIDHFKQINDTYGHLAGDQVLRSLKGVLEQCLRRQDTVGRYGGEEFCILAPETNREGALLLAERVRQALADASMGPCAGGDVHITASIGVAVVEDGAAVNLDSMLSRADQALYRAKHNGRNCVALA